MKKFLAVVLSAAMVLSLAACGGDKKADTTTKAAGETKAATETKAEENKGGETVDTVKIGMMVSLTGSGVQAGEECQALADIFEDIINNKHDDLSLPFAADEGLPGLGGAKVEFVVGDQSTTEIAQSEAERLMTEEGVIGLCGNFSSATTKTAMVPAEKYEVPVISEGTSMSLVEAGYEYFGRSFPGDDLFIDDSFSYLDSLKEGGADIKTLALVSEDSEFGTNIAKVEAAAAEAHGYEIVENISYSAQATNVTSEVLRLKEANADVVMMSSYAADALLFMRAYKEQGYFPKMLFGQRGGFLASDFSLNLGKDSDYALTTSRWNSDMDNQAAKDISKLFTEKTGLTLLGDTLTSVWDGVLLAAAANQAGSTEGAAIRAVMSEGIDIGGKENDPFQLEGYKYAENGQNEYGCAIIIQYLDGKLNTVYPTDSASMEVVYPAKGWNER